MRIAALVLLAGLFALDVYRAATQSLVHDEALTWQLYVAGPFSNIFTYYDPNNHFLHTLLVRLVSGVFGFSELALRLPALAGAALLLASGYQLGGLLFGFTWRLPLLIVLASAHPLVLDFQAAARGYGLALALFLYAVERLLRITEDAGNRRLLWQGAAGLGLSVFANLVFVLPVAAAVAAFWFLAPAAQKKQKRAAAS